MKKINKILEKKLQNIPLNPWVYKMKDLDGRVIYVWKAKNLKNRIKSYFQKTEKRARTEKLVEKIEDIEWIEVNSELEAFLLETNLIKQLLPKYNILMKDWKNFTYLKINIQEKYPKIEIVRQLKKDWAKYFWPKLSAKWLQETVRMLQEIYPIIFNNIYLVNSYPKKIDWKKEIEKLDWVSKEEYDISIKDILWFFQWKYENIEKILQEKMMNYAKEKKFEIAGRLRDMLLEFKKTLEKQIISDASDISQDIFWFFKTEKKVFITLFQLRSWKIIWNENFVFKWFWDDEQILNAIISQYYSITTDLPKEILLPKKTDNFNIFEEFFEENFKKKIKILLPQKWKKSKLVELAESNAKSFWTLSEEKESKNKEKIKKAFSEISEWIWIESTFKRMECVDISHLWWTNTVASMVVFTDWIPDKREYKKFDIKSLEDWKIDDFKSMYEVLSRRLKELERGLSFKKQIPQFEYKKLTKKEIAKIDLFSAKKEEKKSWDFTLIIYKIIKNTKEIWFIPVYKYENKLFEIDFSMAQSDLDFEELKKDFFLKMPNLFAEKKVWIFEENEEKNNVIFIENWFKKLKTFDKNLEENRWLVPEKIAKNSPNKIKKWVFYFMQFWKKIWDTKIPNLILIDWWKWQLSSVIQAFRDLNWIKKDWFSIMEKEINWEKIEIIVASLAKKEEEIFLIWESKSINLPNNCEGSFLFQRIRDEAHRFAITFQRAKRLNVLKK